MYWDVLVAIIEGNNSTRGTVIVCVIDAQGNNFKDINLRAGSETVERAAGDLIQRDYAVLALGKFGRGLREGERTKGTAVRVQERCVRNVISSRRKVWLFFICIIPCVQTSLLSQISAQGIIN
jgi:hypothetical protein